MGLAYALTGNKYDAEDLVQESLAQVLVKWNQVQQATNIDSYVRRSLVNGYTSGRRRKSATEVISHEAATRDHVAPQGNSLEERDAVLRLLWTLPKQQRAVLVLRFYEDLPDDKIAELLGYRAGTVRSHASRGLARLREHLHVTEPPVRHARTTAAGHPVEITRL